MLLEVRTHMKGYLQSCRLCKKLIMRGPTASPHVLRSEASSIACACPLADTKVRSESRTCTVISG